MKYTTIHLLRAAALLAILLVPTSLYAQFTITLPKLPKLPKISKPQTEGTGQSSSTDRPKGGSYDEEVFMDIVGHTSNNDFGGYSNYVWPYMYCYGRKHNIPEETIDRWPKVYGNNSDEMLAKGLLMLAELEGKLKSRMSSWPDTGQDPDHNPAIYYEIAVKRDEYRQCLRDEFAAEESAKQNADADRVARMFLDEVAYTRKEVQAYNPEERLWLGSKNSAADWLLKAVSKNERKKFLDKWQTSPAITAKFNTELDALAAEAPPKIQAWTQKAARGFTVRNPAEETMMRSVMKNISGLVVHSIGLYQATWNIEKNEFGIPIRRYKTGAIYGRDPSWDHPYCWLWTINIDQDYAGGGTYGASYPKYMDRDLVTCPSK